MYWLNILKAVDWTIFSFFYDCDRRMGVINNESHVCNIISESKRLKYYNKSLSCWIMKKKSNYNDSHHHEWISIYNKGISNLEIHPMLLPTNMICFDVLHLSCALGKRLISYLQIITLKSSLLCQNRFLLQTSNFFQKIYCFFGVLVSYSHY